MATKSFSNYGMPGASGMTASDLSFGAPSLGDKQSQASVQKYQLPSVPTTAGDLNTPGSMFNLSKGFMNQSNEMMADPSQIDIWKGRNAFGKTMYNQDGSFDLGAAGSILQGLGGLGSLYLGFQANKTAQDSLDFKKQAYEKNMANQIASFNMALEDKARSRAVQSNQAPGEADAYINKHKL